MQLLARFTGGDRRKLYYYLGTAMCVVGILFLFFLRLVVSDQRQVPKWIGGYCAIMAAGLSGLQIMEHLSLFADPECQTKVVRILFMVPLYAVTSWLSIVWPEGAEYLDLIRDTYESYAIYAFFALMLAQMGGLDALYRNLMSEERPPLEHFFPLCWLEPVKISPRFVQNCRLALFQFMVFKPLITFVVIFLTAKDEMGKDIFDVRKGWFWTALLANISITTAFSALVYFYYGTKEFLAGKNALRKFLCIKAVVFLSFWQGIVIAVLANVGVLPKFDYWTEATAARGLQNFLICIEMLLIAFAHKFSFPTDEHLDVLRDNAGANNEAAVGLEDLDGPAIDAGYPAECPVAEDELQRLAASLPPARRSASANLRLLLRHEDVLKDIADILHRR